MAAFLFLNQGKVKHFSVLSKNWKTIFLYFMTLAPRKNFSRRILKIAIPAIAGMSAQMVVSIAETAMVGRLSNAVESLAAMGLGVLATWVLTSFFSSLATGTHILVARRFGERDYNAAGVVLNNSLILSLILGSLIATLGYFFSYEFISIFSSDHLVAQEASEYIKYRSLGIPFFLLSVSYRGFFYGIGHTKIFLYSAILSYVVNIVFDYFFIFGIGFFPQLGLAGAGLSASLGMLAGLIFFILVTFLPDYRKRYRYYHSISIQMKTIQQIVKISLPVSFQNVLILFGFLIFVAIAGILGTIPQAATQVVITSLFISIMPCFGFGVATQTLVGNSLGNKKVYEARLFALETAKLTTYFTICIGLLFVALPDLVLHVVTNDRQVINTARPILQLAGVAQVIYGSGIILANALQAAGATLYVMYLEIITQWIIFLPLSYLLGHYFGLLGMWFALPIYVIFYSLFAYTKFRSNTWTSMKV